MFNISLVYVISTLSVWNIQQWNAWKLHGNNIKEIKLRNWTTLFECTYIRDLITAKSLYYPIILSTGNSKLYRKWHFCIENVLK